MQVIILIICLSIKWIQPMESTDSSTGSQQQPQLPPGFRFHPTDEELVVHYLKKKAASAPLPVAIIAEVNLYKFDPWELPAKASFGEQEWYFFSPRDRKYPNGARPNRAATSGYWKATGTDKPVLASGGGQKVGVKKALVFYGGKPPKGIKTNWIMHEYRLADNNKSAMKSPGYYIANKKESGSGSASLRLDDWVLCRIYKKNNTQRSMDHESTESMNDDNMIFPPKASTTNYGGTPTTSTSSMLENHEQISMFQGMECNADGSISICAPASKSQLSNLPCSSNFLSIKPNNHLQTSSSSLYWNPTGGGSSSAASTKRFNLTDGGRADDDNSSIASLLCQLPQTLHHQLGNIGDGVFRQPPYHQLPGGMNWYS